MTFPFWPFRKRKTKLEMLQQAATDIWSGAVAGVGAGVAGVGANVGEKLEALPLDRVTGSLKQTRDSAADALGTLSHTTAGAASGAASTLSSTAAQATALASGVVSGVAKVASAKIADARDTWHDKTDQWQDSAHDATQSASESAQKVLRDATQAAAERAADLASKAGKTAKSASQQAQSHWKAAPKTASQAAEAASENLQSARTHAAELATLAAAALAEWKEYATRTARKQAERAAHDAQEAATRAAEIARKQVKQKTASAQREVADISSTGSETAHAWRDSLAARFAQASDDMQEISKKAHKEKTQALESAQDNARKGRRQADKTRSEVSAKSDALAASGKEAVRHAPHSVPQVSVPQVHVEDATSKWLWIAFGALAGAALMLFLAPNEGRRSRALAKDKLRQAGGNAAKLRKEAARRAADLRNRAEGKLHEVKNAKAEDFADDVTIADRVRTMLGENEATHNLERINVDCVDGAVTLRGPMMDEALKTQIESIVREVKGVREVHAQFLIEDSSEDVFVG